MTAHRAYVGIGTNAGDRRANVARAIAALGELGSVTRHSALYRTLPWGKRDQPCFLNAVALLETSLTPRTLLDALQEVESRLGRIRGERWGPRVIDLDLLLYDELRIDSPELRVPHPRMAERAFVLVPLAEIDDRFEGLRDALDASELAGVVRAEDESDTTMPLEVIASVSERIRALARFLADGDAVRVRIERDGETIELSARPRRAAAAGPPSSGTAATRVDTIKADLVGIFHLSRPAPAEGGNPDADRELGYVEALGIRTPVHSMGAGRLVEIPASDGAPVEYGQTLFVIAR